MAAFEPTMAAFEPTDSELTRHQIDALWNGHDQPTRAKDCHGRTLFHLACCFGNLSAAQLLLEANPDHLHTPCDDGTMPLQDTVEYVDVVRWLVEQGAYIHCVNGRGDTPILDAAFHGNSGAVHFLHEQGADIFGRNDAGMTPFMQACLMGHLDTAKMIAAMLGDKFHEQLWLKNNAGQTIMFIACRHGHLTTAQWLYEVGFNDVNTPDNWGTTPIHAACVVGYDKYLDVAKWLFEMGANLHTVDGFGRTPLISVCTDSRDMLPEAKWLISKGVDIHHPDGHGDTAMYYACLNENKKLMEYLHEEGADVRAVYQGRSLLHCMLDEEIGITRLKAATWLLLHGAITDKDGYIDLLDLDLDPFRLSLKPHFDELFEGREGFMCLLGGMYVPSRRKRAKGSCVLPMLRTGKFRVLPLVAEFAGVVRGRGLRIARQVSALMAF
jgi:ankyrin repeat protein